MSKIQNRLPIFTAAALASCAPAHMYPIADDIDDDRLICQNKAPMGSHIAEVECRPMMTGMGDADARATIGDEQQAISPQLPIRVVEPPPPPPEGTCGGEISD